MTTTMTARTPFTQRLYDTCDLCPDMANGYDPFEFKRMLDREGSDFAPRAKKMLREGLHDGLIRLAREGAIELSMEWEIATGKWPEFDKRNIEDAKGRIDTAL